MKKILLIIILLLGSIASISYAGFFDFLNPSVGVALRTFTSIQEGTSPTDGDVLQTDGSKSTWVATSTLGIASGSGTVTSVDMSVPTGLTIAGNPITTSGTLALSLTAGYQMLTDVASTTWDGKWTLASGVFDPYGQATSTLSSHTTTYNHANYDTAYGWGNWASNFGTGAGTIAQGNDSRINNGQTAYGWGDHSVAGYNLQSFASSTYAVIGGAFHDGFSDFVANEHLDWTSDQGATNINAGNYTDTNTTYTSSDFTHDSLSGVSANEHLDWTADLGVVNINAGNYTDTNTQLSDGDIGAFGYTKDVEIDWTASQSPAVIHSDNYTDTNTTYTGGTGLTLTGTDFDVDTSQNIATLSNLTGNGFVKTSGGTGALSIDTSTYLTGNETVTLSGDVGGSGATSITTTIGADKILETMLKSVNEPTDEYALTYEATTGDFEWQVGGGGFTTIAEINAYLTGETVASTTVETLSSLTSIGTLTGLTVAGTVNLDDSSGSSPLLYFIDEDNQTMGLSKNDAGFSVISNSEGAIRFEPSGDVDDYLYVSTAVGVVTLATQAGDNGDLVITAGGGDISFGDDNIFTTGNVGIGVTTPAQQLEISQATATSTLRLSNLDTTLGNGQATSKIEFYSEDASYGAGVHSYIQSRSENAGAAFNLDFYTGYPGGLVQAMTMDDTGDIGINDTTPTYKLDVNGTGRFVGALTATLTGNVTGDLTGNADTVTGFTPASGSLTLSGADALTFTTTGATNSTLPLGTKTLVATDVATLSSLTSIGTIGTGTWQATDVGVAYGGTGVSTLTQYGVLVGNGATDITALTVGTNGQLLVGSTGADPVFATLNADRSLTATLGAGTIEIDADVELYTGKHKISFEDPTADDDFFFGEVAIAQTFDSIYCKTLVGTVTLDVQIAGVDINGTDIVCDTTGVLDSTLGGDTAGAVGEELKLAITSVATAPTFLMLQINYTYND